MAFRATAYQRRLEEAGFEPKMAYAQAAAMEEFVVSEMVTKDHLDGKLSELRSELKTDIATLRSEFKAELATMEVRLIRWMVGTVGGATLAIVLTILRVVK
jgi:hypothetical protein